jgi:polysaccharide export outer membrane protein
MKSGSSGFLRRGRISCYAILVSFILGGGALAQQPEPVTPKDQTGSLPAVPVGQAAASASGAGANPAKIGDSVTGDSIKEQPDAAPVIKLGLGDLIEVGVYNVPELATKARVSNSGDIYLPLIDYVHVEGLTAEEAQGLIEKRLTDGGFVRNPHVTIFVDEASSQGITVLGEVARPGIYPNTSDHKLYAVISEAGGFSQSASRKIAIMRRNQQDPLRITLPRNLGDDMAGNVEIMPGDTITVPRAPIVYVVGDVSRPTGLLVDNGSMSVLQALALVGGTNHTAKLSAARIIRKDSTGTLTETKIQIKKMLEAKAPDVTLQADDILFIPVSGAKVAASRTIEAAITVGTTVGIYTIRP